MQDSSKNSPNSPPQGDKRAFLLWASPGTREEIRDAARQGNFDELRGAADSAVAVITKGYCLDNDSFEEFEPLLHDLWYHYYQGGCYIPHDSAEQDRLAFHLLRIQGRGRLIRAAQSGDGVEIAQTPDGVLWETLPCFVADMTMYWVNDCATMEAGHRLNFAYFLARLATTGLDSDRLFQIALLLFRDTFETARPLGSLNDAEDANTNGKLADLTIAALLPAACAWICEAGSRIVGLSDASWNDCSGEIGHGGATYLNSDLGQRSPSAGFSPGRWLYWMKRLDEIVQEATKAGETALAEQANSALDCMLTHIDEQDSRVRKEFEAAGDDFIHDKDRFTAKKWFARHPSAE
jgi:hypothetical protein